MRISKFAVGLLISMILLSIFLANLAKVLSTDLEQIPRENSNNNVYLKATDTFDNLIWFLQVGKKSYVCKNMKKTKNIFYLVLFKH